MRAAGKVKEVARRGVRQPELRAARADILIGMFFSNLVMFFIILSTSLTLHRHGVTNPATSRQIAETLQPLAGRFAQN